MKVTGIVAEYNPLHKGHEYNLREAKRITGADYIVVVMSGDFVQRGAPALCDKYMRSQMALSAGADLVLELPVCYSAASAEYFASASVAIFDRLGMIDNICFGSECGNIEILKKIAAVLADEPFEFRQHLKAGLKEGKSYPVARAEALYSISGDHYDISGIMNNPNNILGIEYLKALCRRNSAINPVTVKRLGSDYHEMRFEQDYSSALSIRTSLHDRCSVESVRGQVSDNVYEMLSNGYGHTLPVYTDDFSDLLKYKLLLENEKSLRDFTDVSDALSSRIFRLLPKYKGYDAFCDELKTKEMTYTRISRALLHILLDMKSEDFRQYVDSDFIEYARIIGFRENSGPLLKAVKSNATLSVVSKLADAKKALSPLAMKMLDETCRASLIYNSVAASKFGSDTVSEFERQINIL